MAALVVKKADDVTNITYDVLTPSSGDNSPAVWRQDTGASVAIPLGMRALLAMKALWNGPKTARRTVIDYKRPYPVLNTATGRYESIDSVVIHVEVTAPQGMPPAEINEGVYQGLNCCGALLTRQSAAAGFGPQ